MNTRPDNVYLKEARNVFQVQKNSWHSPGGSPDHQGRVFKTPKFPRDSDLYEIFNQYESGDCRPRKFFTSSRILFDVSDENLNASTSDSDAEAEDDESGTVDVFDIARTSKKMDQFLFVWHSSLMITCLFLLIVGIVLRFHFTTIVLNSVRNNPYFIEYEKFMAFSSAPRELVFGDLTQTLGNALIVLNGVHILCIMMYMSFQIHKNHFTLPVVCIISGVVVVMEINATNVYMSETSAQSKESKDNLEKNIHLVYNVEDSTVFSVTHDIISIWGHCCGVTSMYDFQNHTGLKFSAKTDKERKPIQYPPTCCNETFFSLGDKARDAVKNCAFSGEGVYSDGCYSMMFDWLNFYCILYSGVIMCQLLDIFIHLALYKKMVTLFRETSGQ